MLTAHSPQVGRETLAADEEAARVLLPPASFWGAFFHWSTVDEPALIEQLLFDHSAFVVPHLDAVAARSLDYRFTIVAPDEPHLGLHYCY